MNDYSFLACRVDWGGRSDEAGWGGSGYANSTRTWQEDRTAVAKGESLGCGAAQHPNSISAFTCSVTEHDHFLFGV
jgi:hypothetical protein